MLREFLLVFLLLSTSFSLKCYKGVHRREPEGGKDLATVACPEHKGEELCCTKHWTSSIPGVYGCRRRCPTFKGNEWCTSNTCYCKDGSGKCDPHLH